MELQSSSFLLLFIFLPFLLVLIKRLLETSKHKNSTTKQLPGPWKLPFIGNIHQLWGSLPHRTLRDLAKKHGPLMHLKIGELSTVVVSSTETAKEVLKNHDIDFADRPTLFTFKIVAYDCTDIIFSPYGDYWRQLRKICMIELLGQKRVQSFHSAREEEVSNLIKILSSHERLPINFSEMFLKFTHWVISRATFGKKYKGHETFTSFLIEISKLSSGFNVADMYPSIKLLQLLSGIGSKLKKVHQIADGVLQNIINEHRKRRTVKSSRNEAEEDVVDVLLKFQQQGDLQFPLTDNNIKAVIMDILAGGSETSSTVLEWAMSEMMKNPRVMQKAQAEVREVFKERGNVDETGIHELKFLKSVIKETLRLHPPFTLIQRECRSSCQVMGFNIPIKTQLVVNTWAIGRDPAHWTEPERFYPERFLDNLVDFKGKDFEFIPFGSGRRICPGISFAIANIELALAHLLYHFEWKLPGGMNHQDLDMTEGYGSTIRRKKDLFLVPIPYVNPLPGK